MTGISNSQRGGYDEGCLAAHALDLIGDRWALLAVRELMLGAARFGALRAGMPGISANILTRRLAELAQAGVVVRRKLPPPARVQVYELTAAGLALRPVVDALCRWGAGMPGHDPGKFISPVALMLSMAAMIDRAAARELRASAVFRIGEEVFAARLADGGYAVARAENPAGELKFAGGANDLAAAIYGPRPLAESIAAGRVGFLGDLALGQRFVDLFALR